MSFSYGFYNSLNHDRVYDATVIGQLFDGMIMDGVYSTIGDKFIVHASGQGMRVNVGSGRAWFNHTWNFNDTDYPITPEDAEVILDRIDALVIDVNTQVEYRENQIMFVKGTPSSTPERPTLINSDGHYQYPLAYILIPASSTEVLEANITNMVGTDECPFATGLLQQVSTSELIAQWGAEWRLWSNQEKAAFINWMNSEEADFDSWSDAQKAAFTLWMSEEKTEFDEWFANIQDILDGDVAGHLQNEIDEIKRDGMLGSIFNITTLETTLYGKRVTVSDGTVSKYAEFDNTGSATIKSYESVGNLHFSSTDNTRTAQYDLSVPYYGVYDVELNFWAATVNITAQSAILYGQTVTVKKDNVTVGTCVLSAQGVGVYTATEPGNYIFEISYEDGGVMKTVTQSLTVSAETTYNISFSVGFDLQEWLTAGGVSGTYANLAAVLADEEAVRQLMTIHASVDYLASFEDDDSSVITILNNDYAAKWISLRDYAEDILEAAYGTLMGTIGKYGYGEWGLVGKVPKMTSNTAPSGEALGSSEYSSAYPYWHAFDGTTNIDSVGDCYYNEDLRYGRACWLQYKFTNPVCAKKFKFTNRAHESGDIYSVPTAFKIQGSNDGTTFTDIGSFTNNNVTAGASWEKTLNNNTAYLYYRMTVTATSGAAGGTAANQAFACSGLQFYAWEPLGNVPVMTSNSAPYGEASASATASGCQPYYPFSGVLNNWQGTSTTNQRLIYKSANPICVRRITLVPDNDSGTAYNRVRNFKVQGSNDGSTWTDIYSGTAQNATTNAKQVFNFDNDTYYLYNAILVVDTYTTKIGIQHLQFYGRTLKVSVPKMSGNTTPYGEAICSASSSNQQAWKAFDGTKGSTSNIWYPNRVNMTNEYVGYEFPSPIVAKRMVVQTYSYAAPRASFTAYIEGYDGSDWVTLETVTLPATTSATNQFDETVHDISGNTPYSSFRLRFPEVITTGGNNLMCVSEMQFFGEDYSEREWDTTHPRRYLYDHGVEVETLTRIVTDSTVTADKNANNLFVRVPATASKIAAFYKQIDLTDYSMIHAKMGQKLGGTTWVNICIWTQVPNYSGNGQVGFVYTRDTTPDKPYFYLDITSFTDNKYVSVDAFNANAGYERYGDVEEVWLQ